MSIIIPIEGATSAPSEVVTYAAESSISVVSNDKFESLLSVDVLGLSTTIAGGSISPSAVSTIASEGTISPSEFSTSEVLRSLQPVAGESFLVMADLVNENLTREALLSNAIMNINGRLKVGGVTVPIKSFKWSVPTGKLGGVLTCTLKSPDLTLIPTSDDVRFDIVVKPPTGPEIVINLLYQGKFKDTSFVIQSKTSDFGGPTDEVTFTAIDVLADVFSLGPRQPVIMFDPLKVKFDEVNKETPDALYSENGKLIYPVLEPVMGLTSKQVIDRTYSQRGGAVFVTGPGGLVSWGSLISTVDQTGIGFNRVITNLKNYPVRRADFTIEGGWHAGAQPFISMFTPLYFVNDETLFIIDPDSPLPYETTAHPIRLDSHKRLTQRKEFANYNNAVMLTYQTEIFNATSSRPEFDETIDESGTAGDPGYTKTVTRKYYREFFDADSPTVVLGTIVNHIDVETFQTVILNIKDTGTGEVTQINKGVALTHKETTDYVYKNEMLDASTKVTKALITNGPLASMILQEVETERVNVIWTDDPFNPGIKLQSHVFTDITGRVAYLENTETLTTSDGPQTGVVRAVPVLQAQRSGLLTSATKLSATPFEPIKSIRDSLVRAGGKQFLVKRIENDYLNNTINRTTEEPTTGSVEVDTFETKSVTVLIRDATSEASIGHRIPVSINAYELPRKDALAWAKNVLYRMNHPLDSIPLDLVDLDFGIMQGTVIRGEYRDGTFSPDCFVTGFEINGTGLGVPGEHRINMSVETTQIIPQRIIAETD